MSTNSKLPKKYDAEFIMTKLKETGVTNHYGYSYEEDGLHIVYRATDFDTVQSVIDAYQVDYANEVLRPKLMSLVTEVRWTQQQYVPDFNGDVLPADDITISRVIAALDFMDRNPDMPRTRNWKIRDNEWVELDYDTIEAMGRAIGVHIQNCFDREKELHAEIMAATTVDELEVIDIHSGW